MVPRQPSEGTLEHFQAYLLLAAIPAAAIKRRGRTRVAILSVACLGMVLEVAQMQIPGRAFEWRGVIANSLGVTVGRLAAPAGRDGGSAARAGAAEPDCPAGATMRPTEPPASGACAEGCVSPASRRPCPRCGSTRVYCSHRRGLLERWLSLVGLKIRRCHACNLRFTRFGGSTLFIEDGERVLRRLALVGLMAAGVAAVLVVMMWLNAKEAAFPPDQ